MAERMGLEREGGCCGIPDADEPPTERPATAGPVTTPEVPPTEPSTGIDVLPPTDPTTAAALTASAGPPTPAAPSSRTDLPPTGPVAAVGSLPLPDRETTAASSAPPTGLPPTAETMAGAGPVVTGPAPTPTDLPASEPVTTVDPVPPTESATAAGPSASAGSMTAADPVPATEPLPAAEAIAAVLSGGGGCIAEARHLAVGFLAEVAAGGRTVSERSVHLIQLVVSELVTNACKYAPGPVLLKLRVSGDTVEVEVWDGDPVLPTARVADPGRVGQHGLEIVKAIAVALGVERAATGKRVTATIALDPDSELGGHACGEPG
ncbi:ATP-binding protein [Streptomyces sp. 1222.5]|uniref:ATP-binding protein n=1 Tax=Streptomyces sp. 1222.5 TaxID=1881026 RepID=UPI003EB9B2BC